VWTLINFDTRSQRQITVASDRLPKSYPLSNQPLAVQFNYLNVASEPAFSIDQVVGCAQRRPAATS